MSDQLPTWKQLFPNGRDIFYEGDDPVGFAAEIKTRFGIDPSVSENWNSECGYSFHCPADLLDEIYGSDDYPMGS